ncbi:conjugal transfer protein [Nocardiopsis sp. CNT-189]|uniref:conjugal transfer protein n=1 Tax=Nocardiopsis oceanisediminis TaxID=2816862 RepID=UPI003B3941FC
MARRSTARGGGAPEAADGYDGPREAATGRLKRPRAGSGGRWWVWVGRAVLWAFIIVVLINGIWHPLREGIATPAAEEPAEQEEGGDFPETAAAAFAVRFAEHYLNVEEGGRKERAEALAAFVPEGAASSYEVSGGPLTGTEIQVVQVEDVDGSNAVVTLAADVNGAPMTLDVPVYAAGPSSLVVSGRPALLAAPDKADLPEAPGIDVDTDARAELESMLPAFFEAYSANPDHLSQYVESGVRIAPLPADTLAFEKLDEVAVPARTAAAGDEDVRQAVAEVVWRVPGGSGGEGATLTQSYQLTVVESGGKWYVRDVQGSLQGPRR